MDTKALNYEHKIPPTSNHNATGPIQNFTATGRPFDPSTFKQGSGLHSLNGSESMSGSSGNYLPRQYTDDSVISIAVLPPKESSNSSTDRSSRSSTWSDDTLLPSSGPIKYDTSSTKDRLKFWKGKSWSKRQPTFVMKSVTRGEYLKHYAKDDHGWYIGTEPPAEDCILSQGSDVLKWRQYIAEQKAAEAYRKVLGSTGQDMSQRDIQMMASQHMYANGASINHWAGAGMGGMGC